MHELEPGARYTFRIRAFNGFGPGPFTWATFSTRPRRPNTPVLAARAPTSVTLRWGDEPERAVRALEAALDELGFAASARRSTEAPGSGPGGGSALGRAQLASALVACDAATADALVGARTKLRSSGATGAAVSLLDAIDAPLVWAELRAFLLKALARPPALGTIRYTVEQCVSITSQQWRRVLTTRSTHAVIGSLPSGVPQRFRVFAANELESLRSPSCVVTPQLETPAAPRLAAAAAVGSLKLCWDAGAVGLPASEARKLEVDRILHAWAEEGPDEEGPVSIVHAVRKQPSADAQGSIHRSDLRGLLAELGVDPTDARCAEVLAAAGSGSDRLPLDALRAWWGSSTVTYEVRRHDMGGGGGHPMGGGGSGSLDSDSSTVICYKGTGEDGRACTVSGLEPNHAYSFSMRVSTPRATSNWSGAVEVHTPPAPLERPVLVASDKHALTLKWYPGKNGAHKYVVEAQLVDALDARAERHAKGKAWAVLYEGRDNTARVHVGLDQPLLPNCAYRVRVTALDSRDGRSAPSEATLCRTSASRVPGPAKAHEHFTVECRGDVAVGDTVVCTEQLHVGRDGKVSSKGVFVGERTVAAVVVKDSFRCPLGRASPSRTLRLIVNWSTVSTDAAAPFQLAKGAVIEREEASLNDFELFRAEWIEESRRLPEARERAVCMKLVL